MSLPSERLIGFQKRQEELQKELPELLTKQVSETEMQELRQQLSYMYELGPDTGLSDTLKQLRERGILDGKNVDYSGRALDKKPHEDGIDKPEDRIVLEYRDETGRIMTKK